MFRFLSIVFLICGVATAQETNPTSQPQQSSTVQTDQSGAVPIYRITVVDRSITAINYFHRSGSTKIGFKGTSLMPVADGSAEVESRRGRMVVDAKFDHLESPNRFGPEYLTYVLWAITPEGRPQNLGEVLLDGSKSAINVTTDLQAFGLIVTAEPYYAVTQPSDVVVLENVVRPETVGKIEQVNAKYQLLPRGQYVYHTAPSSLIVAKRDSKVPLELEEARNAVQLAGVAGADQYAGDSYNRAKTELQNAEGFQSSKAGSKKVITAAREAVQHAEDARVIALRKMKEEAAQKEREAAQQRTAEAQAQAVEATQKAERESTERAQAEAAKAEAERAKAEAETATLKAQQEKAQAEAAQQAAQQQQQALQSQAEQAKQQADVAAQRAQQAETEKAQLRERLRQQLNTILETRETARGLIVNMSDVLFDTGKYTLKPGAREKLAKVAGILLAYPGLKVQIEGHTDNVGADEYNQRLSEQRAMTVRDYLVSQGVDLNSVTAQGLGKNSPVASNATPTGRQQNRRVELVVSGEPIGNTEATAGTLPNTTVQPGSSTAPGVTRSSPAPPPAAVQPGIANPAGSQPQPNNNPPPVPK